MQNEHYDHGSRLKAYIVEVRKTAKGPQIVVSRTHPGLVKRLFELEVPEIVDGVVELKAIAREPGHRTKLAVSSNDNNVDPVGACVGARGSRVRMVVNELRGEKVDIVPYSDDPSEFVMKALAPARVREVRIHPDTGTAEVIVPDFQLSLAIGKEGQNARLAARLTGWRVDIKSEAQLAEEEAGGGVEYAEGEWVTNDVGELVWQPAEGGDAISAAEAGYAAPAPETAAAADAPAADAPADAAAPAADAARARRRRPEHGRAGCGRAGSGRCGGEAAADGGADGEAAAAPRSRPGRRSARRDGGGRRLARRRPDRSAPASGVDRPRASRSWCASVPSPPLPAPAGWSSGRGRGGAPGSAGRIRLRASKRRSAGGRWSGHCAPRYGMTRSSAYARDCSPVNRLAINR